MLRRERAGRTIGAGGANRAIRFGLIKLATAAGMLKLNGEKIGVGPSGIVMAMARTDHGG